MLSRFFDDVRYAARTMRRQPVVAVTIVLTLAIGTGATIAIFSVVDAALMRPLPYPDPDDLAVVVQVSDEFGRVPFAPPFLDDFRARTRSFASLAGFSASGWTMTLTEPGDPRVVSAAYVSDGLFELLGARARHGRLFTADEHAAPDDRVAVVSAPLWDSTFGEGAEPSGQVIRLAGQPYRVVGVLPADFRLPITGSIVSSSRQTADVLLRFAEHWSAELRIVPIMNLVGRLADGVELEAASAEVDALRPVFDAEFPDAELAPRFRVLGLADLVTEPARATVWMLFAAAALLLLIACVNIANLMLARAGSRQREIAVRAALGAGRGRLAEQMLTEALLFAAAGCGGGLLLATWLLSAVPALGLESLPPSAHVAVDLRVAAFAILLAVGCAGAFGLLPVVYSWRVRPFGRLRQGSQGSTVPARGARRGLVVGAVAVAVVLLVGAGLLSTSFWRLSRVDPGFRSDGLMAVPLAIADAGLADAGARSAFVIELLERLQGLPGIGAAAAVNRLPLGGSNVLVGMEAEGQALPEDAAATVDRRVVTPGYFELMGIEIVDGRDFTAADDAGSGYEAAIVNETAAELFWPGLDAAGRRARLMLRGGAGPWMTIVGVVADVRHHGLAASPRPEIYVPYRQSPVETMVAVVRVAPPAVAGGAGAAGVTESIKSVAWSLDPDLPMDRITSVDEVVSASVSEPRLRTVILGAFAALALTLAAIGVAGIVSQAVIQQRRDIALRAALGARGDQLLWQTVREGLVLGLGGAVVGLAAATLLSRWLESLLFEVGAHDPSTFLGATALLLAIIGVASWLPARQATRIDPVIALKSD